MKKTLENPITFRRRCCRFCGKSGANFVPEVGKGFSHLKCWKDYQSAQQSVQPTAFGIGTQAQFPPLGGNQAEESSATHGGG